MPVFNTTQKVSIHFNQIENVLPLPTFFIHGNLASNQWWMPAAEELQKLKTSSDLSPMICAEFRGCGNSSVPTSDDEVTIHNFATDFVELVRSLGHPKVDLVGHSTGGTIAAYMLTLAPELFDRAYLLDPVGAEGVRFDPAMISAFEAMKKDHGLTATVIGSTIRNNNPDGAFFKDIIVADAFKSVKSVGHLVLKALDGLDLRAKLQNVTHPVKVVHGEFDSLLPIAESKKMADLFKNGTFEMLLDCGHCANIEKPDYFARDLKTFLSKNH